MATLLEIWRWVFHVNSTSIPVLGVATVRILVVDSPAHYTIAAVCADTEEDMFLSKSVLMELGIVHDALPKVIREKVNICSVSEESCASTVRTAPHHHHPPSCPFH